MHIVLLWGYFIVINYLIDDAHIQHSCHASRVKLCLDKFYLEIKNGATFFQ